MQSKQRAGGWLCGTAAAPKSANDRESRALHGHLPDRWWQPLLEGKVRLPRGHEGAGATRTCKKGGGWIRKKGGAEMMLPLIS